MYPTRSEEPVWLHPDAPAKRPAGGSVDLSGTDVGKYAGAAELCGLRKPEHEYSIKYGILQSETGGRQYFPSAGGAAGAALRRQRPLLGSG